MMAVRATDVRDDLALGLANTLDWRGREHPEERLVDDEALRAWAAREGVAALAAGAALDPALALRETILRVFDPLARGAAPAGRDLRALEEAVREAASHVRLVPVAGGFDYGWEPDGTPRALLRPVAWSAGELLRSPDALSRLRRCANDPCGWLFLDRSRSRTRRWCDMRACGNREKARRHYARSRGG